MALRRHEIFHLDRKPFFEGVYYKISNASAEQSFAVIPGLAYTESEEEDHAFIQFFDGIGEAYHYFKYPISDFSSAKDRFAISIGDNHFDFQSIHLDIAEPRIQADLSFEGLHPWPGKGLNKRTMSWVELLPRMECYYSIMSFRHAVHGGLHFAGRQYNLDNGKGYMEKNWGSSFPSSWIWMNSTHFSREDVSLTVAIAMVPYLGMELAGLVAGLMIGDQFYSFTTYRLSKVKKLDIQKGRIYLELSSRKYRLEITGLMEGGVLMNAPDEGRMDGRCLESLKSKLHVTLVDKRAKGESILFQDVGKLAGLEINGNTELLRKKLGLK